MQVKTELRQLVAKLRHSKSAKITSEARKRRYQRQTKEALEPAEMDRRTEITAKSFQKWSFGDETIPLYKVLAQSHLLLLFGSSICLLFVLGLTFDCLTTECGHITSD